MNLTHLILFSITFVVTALVIGFTIKSINDRRRRVAYIRNNPTNIFLRQRIPEHNVRMRQFSSENTWAEIRLVMRICLVLFVVVFISVFYLKNQSLENKIQILGSTIVQKDAIIEEKETLIVKKDDEYEKLYSSINIPHNIGGFDIPYEEIDNIPIGCPIDPETFQIPLVVSYFGKRLNPFTKKPTTQPHSGVDIAGPMYCQIMTTGTGFVEEAGTDPAGILGKYIIINHRNGFKTVYGHLSSIYVNVGDEVNMSISIDEESGDYIYTGDVIGRQGATGLVTGDHLHYGLIWNDKYVDPMIFLSSFLTKDPGLVADIIATHNERTEKDDDTSVKDEIVNPVYGLDS